MTERQTPPPYSEEFLEQMRDRLFALRERADHGFRDLAGLALEPSGQDSSFEQPADFASEESAEDVNLGLLEHESNFVVALDDAIARIDGAGPEPYGLCVECRDEPLQLCPTCPWIAEERLRESPWVRRCAPVQARHDPAAPESSA